MKILVTCEYSKSDKVINNTFFFFTKFSNRITEIFNY